MATSLNKDQVAKAVKALWKHQENYAAKKSKASMLDDEGVPEETVLLVIGMMTFPEKRRLKPYKIPLPHSLHEDSDMCIFVKDPQSTLKERLEADPIVGVTKVIGIEKLKNNYKTYEAKRKLCDGFDLFLADKRILPMLPKLLGKQFFKKRRHPVPVDIARSAIGLQHNVYAARDSTQLLIGEGPCSAVRVARTGMAQEDAVENILAAMQTAIKYVPGKWENIQAINLKTTHSLALPVFNRAPAVTKFDPIDHSKGESEPKKPKQKSKERKAKAAAKEAGPAKTIEKKGKAKGGKKAEGAGALQGKKALKGKKKKKAKAT